MEFYNTLTRSKEQFMPYDANNVRMYVCGPTVYDLPHIGNARSVVVYDILFRLLRAVYGENQVLYVRNITDVDDKINIAAKAQNITIQELTNKITKEFHADIDALGCLRPNIEPKATEHIDGMISMITKLIENESAYVQNGHVYFRVSSCKDYGKLAGRDITKLIAGARIDVNEDKESPEDFVLWKPASHDDDKSSVFQSPWGGGRPGWHIECSVMSSEYLGDDFDIHGGGADLMFPHHTNEIAQSCCANPHSNFAKYWIHNGFVTVNKEKMSKSLGNFITVRDLLNKGVDGTVIRLALLGAHYHKPLDWNDKLVLDAKKTLTYFANILKDYVIDENAKPSEQLIDILSNDMNMPEALAYIHNIARERKLDELAANLNFLDIYPTAIINARKNIPTELEAYAASKIIERKIFKDVKNWQEADRIRDELQNKRITIIDLPSGESIWEYEG
jgi:cysteinyl-tRNA synthetase